MNMKTFRELFSKYLEVNPRYFRKHMINYLQISGEVFREFADLPFDAIPPEELEVITEDLKTDFSRTRAAFILREINLFARNEGESEDE